MHGPIVMVPAEQEPHAWVILDRNARRSLGLPVRPNLSLEDVPDDHRVFYRSGFDPATFEDCAAWWIDKPSDWVRPCVVFEVCGHLPGLTVALWAFPTHEEAESVGKAWMQECGFDVIETYEGCGECEACLEACEDPNDHARLGWIGHNGRP